MAQLLSLIVPLALLTAPSLALIYWPDAVAEITRETDSVWATLFSRLPYFLAGVIGALAWRFNQARVTYLSVLLAGLYWGALRGDGGESLVLSGLLLCISFPLFFWVRETRLLSFTSLLKIAVIACQWIIILDPEALAGYRWWEPLARSSFLQWSLPGAHVPGVVFLAYFAAVAGLYLGKSATRRALKAGFATALAAALFGLSHESDWWREDWNDRGILVFHFLSAWSLLLYSVYTLSWGRAYTDELTHLSNRRAFDEALQRLGGRYAIAMVDIDHFKKVNDRFGHRIGDQVLAYVASRIKRAKVGRAFRYGGEEFTIICRKNSVENALPGLEDLRKLIESSKFYFRTQPRDKKWRGRGAKDPRTLKVTVSIGVAERTRDLSRPELVIQAADKALYKAKKGGRNKVVISPPSRRRKKK